MRQETRRKNHFPSTAKDVRNGVQVFGTCIKEKRIENLKLRSELLNVPEGNIRPEDAMQIDLLPELPPCGGYKNIVTAIDVFSKYAFANPVFTPTAVNTAKVIVDNMTKHAYLPTLMNADKGSVSIYQVISEVSTVLGHTLKHAQAIGVLERTKATLKTPLKME